MSQYSLFIVVKTQPQKYNIILDFCILTTVLLSSVL